MNRLTKKTDNGHTIILGDDIFIDTIQGYNVKQCINKLGQLEDIEQELGIDLITLFKAITKGVYVKSPKGKIEFIEVVAMDNVRENPCIYYCNENTIDLGGLIRPFYTDLYFKDYGKSWALSKEELK